MKPLLMFFSFLKDHNKVFSFYLQLFLEAIPYSTIIFLNAMIINQIVKSGKFRNTFQNSTFRGNRNKRRNSKQIVNSTNSLCHGGFQTRELKCMTWCNVHVYVFLVTTLHQRLNPICFHFRRVTR